MRRRSIPWSQLAIGLLFASGLGWLLREFAHVSIVVSWLAAGIFFVAYVVALGMNK